MTRNSLVTLAALFEGKRRRAAYKSGRREIIGFALPRLGLTKKRNAPKDRPGRLIARTPYASRTRWRDW